MPITPLGMVAECSSPSLWTHTDRLLSTVPENQEGWKDATDHVLQKESSSNNSSRLFFCTYSWSKCWTKCSQFGRGGIINTLKQISIWDQVLPLRKSFKFFITHVIPSLSNPPMFGRGVFCDMGDTEQSCIKRMFRKINHWRFHRLRQIHYVYNGELYKTYIYEPSVLQRTLVQFHNIHIPRCNQN